MVFINRFYTTKQMYREYVNKVLCRRIYILGAVFSPAAALAFLFSIRNHPTAAAVEGVCFLVITSVMLFTPGLTLKQLLEADRKLHGGAHPECVVIFGGDIRMSEGNQSLTLQYDQVTRIIRLKTCNVLMFTKQNGILYVSGKFTQGNEADFETFILEKCSHVEQLEKR